MGDLTFLHDVGGLLIPAKERGVDLTIVVMNDGGGSIFGALEYGKVAGQSEQAHDVFERVFTTPHRASIAEICAGYGARYTYAPSSDALKNALEKNALGGSAPDESAQRTGERRIHVIEVPVAPELRRTDEVELVDALRASTLTEARC
jgi:2-succinyl-5-enolpyruvyl-6-hydroxy-3-cyclohexene-1-carboxylate synthase